MAITFQNVTKSAGISSTRKETFSVAWTDFNSDGRPDLWISPHGYDTGASNLPKLYLSQRNGTFTNITSQVWPNGIQGDSHGSSWADFDNDGDPDLFVTVGANRGAGENPKFLFINNGRQLQEQAVARGLDYPLGRGRSSLWFDWNQDGLLDILLLNAERPDGQAPTALFQQTENGFEDVSERAGLPANLSALFAQLAKLSDDRGLDLVIGNSQYPKQVYDTTTVPFQNITNNFPDYDSTRDAVIADFDGDLRSDFFLVRNKFDSSVSSLFEAADQRLALAQLATDQGEVGVRFKTAGGVLFDFEEGAPLTNQTVPDRLSRSEIFIGSAGRHPAEIGFSLSPDDPTVWGIKNHNPDTDEGLYIGYDPDSQTWKALFSSPEHKLLDLVIDTPQPLSEVTRIGFGPLDLSQHDRQDILLLHDSASNQYVDRTRGSGLGNPVLGQSAVGGDFDNDMDVDLYVSRGYKTYNLPSTLYENQGDGTFVKVPNAGGAAGRILGPHQIEYGVASRMAVADYDVDGFLDLFVSNTVFEATQETYLGSPHRLFRNQGNDNHWIELDLKGVVSNRDGVGARILATAGGITQLREQGGGMHLFGQNQQQIHFGLGSNSRVDLKIQWSSGIDQEIYNVAADQVLQVVEPVPVNGTSGNNFLQGGNGDNFILGLPGNDKVRGLAGKDTLKGGNGNDILAGGDGSDILTGGDGNDILAGGDGNDILTGWSGADRFVFNSKTQGVDRIIDFSTAVVGERINVSKAGFGGGLTAGAFIKPAQFELGSAAGDSSDRFIYDKFGTGALYFDVDGSGSTGQVKFATLSTGLAMTSADIFVVA